MADRVYVQAIALVQAVADSEYENNDPVQASDGLARYTVINWTDVKVLDKITIHSVALANGFSVESG